MQCKWKHFLAAILQILSSAVDHRRMNASSSEFSAKNSIAKSGPILMRIEIGLPLNDCLKMHWHWRKALILAWELLHWADRKRDKLNFNNKHCTFCSMALSQSSKNKVDKRGMPPIPKWERILCGRCSTVADALRGNIVAVEAAAICISFSLELE